MSYTIIALCIHINLAWGHHTKSKGCRPHRVKIKLSLRGKSVISTSQTLLNHGIKHSRGLCTYVCMVNNNNSDKRPWRGRCHSLLCPFNGVKWANKLRDIWSNVAWQTQLLLLYIGGWKRRGVNEWMNEWRILSFSKWLSWYRIFFLGGDPQNKVPPQSNPSITKQHDCGACSKDTITSG